MSEAIQKAKSWIASSAKRPPRNDNLVVKSAACYDPAMDDSKADRLRKLIALILAAMLVVIGYMLLPVYK